MKKITTKITILMLIIPMLLIFTMSTTINMTSIMVDVPVTSVDIEGEEILFVNVGEGTNTVKLNTIVSPKEATNKNITYTTERVGNEKLANVNVSKDGLVSASSVGTVRVVATGDSGRQDSVQINFYSTTASELTLVNNIINVKVGEKKTINIGENFNVYPSSANVGVTFTANNNKIAVDKYSGEITGLYTGSSVVTASVDGVKYDSSLNKFVETTYTVDFNVNIDSDYAQEIFSFAGGGTQKETVLSMGETTISFQYLGKENFGEVSYDIANEDESYVEKAVIECSNEGICSFEIELKENAPEKDYDFSIKAGGATLGLVTIKRQKPSILLSTSRYTFAKSNANIIFGSQVIGLSSGYVIRYESSNNLIFSVNTRDNECVGKAKNEGSAYIKARLYVNGEEVAVSDTVQFNVVNPYISIGLVENSNTYGLENRFAFAKYEYKNGNVSEATYALNVKASTSDSVESNINKDKVKWSSSDKNIATVSDTGVINVVDDGVVTITIESAYNEILNTDIKTSFIIVCRKKAINVYDYEDLVWANANNYDTVLRNNIMLADGINENNYRDYLANVATKQMDTTASKFYYIDNNKEEDAKIRYCLEITGNVYGNGYYIDANNITRSIDKYNYSIFNGPLDLVSLQYGQSTKGNAKIKSQDNIIFLVKKDNIEINNVELKGCSDSSLIDEGKTNLGRLDYVGTVLEVVGDNISLRYSRVNNGRTVVRVYGKPYESDSNKLSSNVNDYKVQTLIESCILSYAREFILKVGSNQLLRNPSVFGETLELPSANPGKYNHAAPHFTKSDGSNYELTSAKDDYFIDNYLMTDITLKNSVFFGAGLFCVGFESQFAGLALHGYDYSGSFKFSELGWKQVAGTSYPARIKMQGDVRFYDWKEVSSVDSSTLIEGDTSLLQLVGLDLNVSNLLSKFHAENPNSNIIYKFEGKDYVNGAIVFYGGGKNYSWIETTETSNNFNKLNNFEIPVTYFGSRVNLIYYAAGKEDFRFMTYTSNSNINYQTQRNDLADGSAYSWIIRK